MAKNFILLATFGLALFSPVLAQEAGDSQKEREKLIKLVLQLETDFGQTLQDFRLLQKEFAKHLDKPAIPDQRAMVQQLQKQLDQAAQKIREHQKLEAEARKGAKDQEAAMAKLRKTVEGDLAKLRASLKNEQSALAVAQVKLGQIKALEDQTKKLERLLRDETAERSALLGQYQILRGEKNALIARVDGLMERATTAEAAQIKSVHRIAQLEEQAGAIKTQMVARAAEIKKLMANNAKGGAMVATLERVLGEKEKLSKLLKSRETEMGKLRAELASEKKKALDVPMLIKARDEMQGKLAKAEQEQKKLAENGQKLQRELEVSGVKLVKALRTMSELEAKLAKSRDQAAMATKAGAQNKELLTMQKQLINKLELAEEAIALAKHENTMIQAELKKNVELVAAAKKLGDTNKKLMAERDGLQQKLTQSANDLSQMQKGMKTLESDLAKTTKRAAEAIKLGKDVRDLTAMRDALNKELAASRTAVGVLDGEVKKLRADLAQNKAAAMAANKLAQEKKALAEDLEKVKKDFGSAQISLKAMQDELTKANDLAAKATKLGKDNQELAARRDALSEEVAVGKLTMSALNGKVKSLEADLVKNKEAVMAANKLAQEKSALAADLEKVKKDYGSAQSSLKTMQAELAKANDLAAKATKLGKDNQELAARRDALSKEMAVAKSTMAALEGKVKSLEADLAKNKEAVMAANKLAQEKAALAVDLEKVKKEFGTAQTSLKAMNAKLAESMKLAANAKKLSAERDQLSRELKQAKSLKEAAEKSMKLAEAKLSENNKLVEASKKLGQENATLIAKGKQLNTELVAAKAALAKAQKDMTSSQAAMAEKAKLAEAANLLTTERDGLKKALAETKTQLNQAKLESKDAAALAGEAARLKKDYAVVSARVEALEKDKERLGGEVARKDADLKKMRSEMSAKPDQAGMVAKLESQKEKLNADLAAKTEDLKKVRMDLGRLHLSNASMEKQLDQLRRRVATIDPIRYAKGEANVKDQQTRVLTQVKEVLMMFPSANFEIVGHTCDLGSKQGNLNLSRERSTALLEFLVGRGIPAERLKAIGMGDSQPAVPNTNEANRRKNRRVEVLILD